MDCLPTGSYLPKNELFKKYFNKKAMFPRKTKYVKDETIFIYRSASASRLALKQGGINSSMANNKRKILSAMCGHLVKLRIKMYIFLELACFC